MIGKYNCKVKFIRAALSSDGAGGQTVGSDTNVSVESGLTEQWGLLTPVKSDRYIDSAELYNQTLYDLEIRATIGFIPAKDMRVRIDDGVRPFIATVYSVLNTDMQRRFWTMRIIEVR